MFCLPNYRSDGQLFSQTLIITKTDFDLFQLVSDKADTTGLVKNFINIEMLTVGQPN